MCPCPMMTRPPRRLPWQSSCRPGCWCRRGCCSLEGQLLARAMLLHACTHAAAAAAAAALHRATLLCRRDRAWGPSTRPSKGGMPKLEACMLGIRLTDLVDLSRKLNEAPNPLSPPAAQLEHHRLQVAAARRDLACGGALPTRGVGNGALTPARTTYRFNAAAMPLTPAGPGQAARPSTSRCVRPWLPPNASQVARDRTCDITSLTGPCRPEFCFFCTN
jgi:hypothetical protein